MKNKKVILNTVAALVIASTSLHAKLSGTYVGVSEVNVFDDSLSNMALRGTSAVGNMSTINQGFGIEAGYNAKFDSFLLGVGLSYIYAAPNFKYVAKNDEGRAGAFSIGSVSGHRINLDINAGYSFEDKVVLSVGGIISYNPGKPEYTIFKGIDNDLDVIFDKKTTSDFGFGFKVGTNIKLTECISWDISYRMTWFSTTKDYKDYVNTNKAILKENEGATEADVVKVSELNRVDKMITTGIRFNF